MESKDLFKFLFHEKATDVIKKHSIDWFVEEIAKYQRKFNEKPKILINVRGFYDLFLNHIKLPFGCRYNAIKFEFEEFLSILKNAGAELIFTSKKSNERMLLSKEKCATKLNRSYDTGMRILNKINTIKRVNELNFKEFDEIQFNDFAIIALAQSAQKFGKFRENKVSMVKKFGGYVQIANEENVFAILGFNKYFLCYDGSWRFMFVSRKNEDGQMTKEIEEIDRQKILNHFGISYDQLRLFTMLGGNFYSSQQHRKRLRKYFSLPSEIRHHQDFRKMIDFILKYAPRESFPLSKDNIEKMLKEIFTFSDDELVQNFNDSLIFEPYKWENPDRFEDEEINEILQNNPFTTMAEQVLNNFPIYIDSGFLEIRKTDMKSLKDLTLPWIKHTFGLMLRNTDIKSRKVHYRTGIVSFEEITIEIETEAPSFEIPSLKQMLLGEMSDEDKFKFLSFLIDDTVDKDDIKKIPKEFMMHVIILTHLVKNESMEPFEAHAIIKTLRDKVPQILIFPLEVDIRAFRVSALYQSVYLVLLNCLHAVGLKDFISDFTLDNAMFQNKFLVMKSDNDDNVTNENIFEKIMDIVLA